DLAGVDADPQIEPERPDGRAHRVGASDGARRAVEGDEEAVPRALHPAAAIASELLPRQRAVPIEQQAPVASAERRDPARRFDDVREHDGGEYAVAFGRRDRSGQEALDRVDRGVRVAGPGDMVAARQLDIGRAGDMLREIPSRLDIDARVAAAMD